MRRPISPDLDNNDLAVCLVGSGIILTADDIFTRLVGSQPKSVCTEALRTFHSDLGEYTTRLFHLRLSD